jgi:cytochrome b561
MTNWERFAAAWTHNGLYACMLVSPLSGWAASNFSKHGVRFFGIKLEPLGPDLPAVYALLGGVHDVAGWIFIGLLTLHVAAAFKHLWLDRDGIFSRMSWRAPRLGGVATAVRQLKEPT